VTQGATSTEAYTFDPVGNRLTSISVPSYSYNSSNEITATGSSSSYTYDDNGNTLTKADGMGTTTYTWDFENRLTSVHPPGQTTVAFKYDPFGRRIQKSGGVYLYDGADLIEERNAAGNLVARYVFGTAVDEPIAAYLGSTWEFYHADGLGSITSLSTSSGTISDSFTYDSFGNITSSTETFAQPFRYTGREWDSETALYYYRARYYDATAGRFISEDPIGFGGSHDFYTYTGNKPVNFTDPTGWKECLLNPKSRCAKLFQKVLGITPSKFNKDVDLIPWFTSYNIHTYDPLTWNDIAGNGDNDLISQTFNNTSTEARTASPGGMKPAPVVLGPDWVLDTPDRQKAVMFHEAVHSITGYTDAWIFGHFKPYGLPDSDFLQFGNTDAFTRWLLLGCPQKGVKTILPLSELK
jgi:RHS repeat-associated protein